METRVLQPHFIKKLLSNVNLIISALSCLVVRVTFVQHAPYLQVNVVVLLVVIGLLLCIKIMEITKMHYKEKGFTLIELMIAVLLLSVLSGVIISVLNAAGYQGKARDSQRFSDMKRIQSALELYFAEFRSYPSSSGAWVVPSEGDVGTALNSYISPVPTDPSTGANYQYLSSDGKTYQLVAGMEIAGSEEQCQSYGTGACGGSVTTNCCKFTNP